MASDHRGRDLHAGKRTIQDLTEFGGGYLWNLEFRSDDNNVEPARNALANSSVDWEERGYTGFLGGHSYGYGSLGRGKSVRTDTYHHNDDKRVEVGGKVRTAARAEIAANAMQKRVDEGRDLKTGRPIESPKPVGKQKYPEKELSDRLSSKLKK